MVHKLTTAGTEFMIGYSNYHFNSNKSLKISDASSYLLYILQIMHFLIRYRTKVVANHDPPSKTTIKVTHQLLHRII